MYVMGNILIRSLFNGCGVVFFLVLIVLIFGWVKISVLNWL